MSRKQRVDSNAAAVKIMQGSVRQIQPPSHVPLEAMDWPFFESVIEEFARSEWTEHAIEIAAMLARTMANMESEQRLLREEGFTSKSDRGTPVVNPRVQVVKGLTGDILGLRRSLQLHARAQKGEIQKTGPRKEQAKAIEGGLDDDLLARPVLQ